MLKYISYVILGTITCSAVMNPAFGTEQVVKDFKELVAGREGKEQQARLQPFIERLEAAPYDDMQERINQIFSRIDADLGPGQVRNLCDEFINYIREIYQKGTITEKDFFEMLNRMYMLSLIPSLKVKDNIVEVILSFTYTYSKKLGEAGEKFKKTAEDLLFR